MRLLLDTCAILWWFADARELSPATAELIEQEPAVFISPASLWEIGIKQAIGKLSGPDDLLERIRDSEFTELPVRHDHVITASRLPRLHSDPFDRLLVAQAMRERLTIVTDDGKIDKYDVDVKQTS